MKKKLKLLVLTSTYPYLDHHNHPRFVNTLCRHLTAFHDVHVLAPSIAGEPWAGENGLSLFRYSFARLELLTGGDGIATNLKLRPWLFFIVPLYFFSLILHCRQLTVKKKIHLIHAHWIIPQGLGAVISRLVFRYKTPIVITAHGGDLYGFSGRLMTWVKRWVLARADHITVVSRAMKAYCVDRLNCPEDKITVRSMGVDLNGRLFVPDPSRKNPNQLIFVGRLVEKKGVDLLLYAMVKVVKKRPEIRLEVVGGGAGLERLKDLSVVLGLSSAVQFSGHIPNEDLPRHYQSAAVAVMPFRVARGGDQEGLGLTMVEAIGCGCTVVVSDLPAVRDVIRDGETGFLVPPGDPDALAARILHALDAGDQAFSTRARRITAEKFDWAGVTLTYAGLLEKIASDYHSSRH